MIRNKRQLLLDKHAVISHFEFTPPLVAAAELNNEACFIFPINAIGNIYRQDGKREVRTSEGVLMKCGQYINKWQAIDTNENAEVVIIRLQPEILASVLDQDLKSSIKEAYQETTQSPTTAVIGLDIMLQKYLESLLFYFDNPQLVSNEIVLLKIKELSLLLLKTPQANPVKELFLRMFEPTKYSLQEIVDANYLEDLNLDELAALSNMSTPTFKRKFKHLIGESPGSYIRKKRLELAAIELKNTHKTITEIAFDCGYNDSNHFAKSFAKKFGVSPRAYRKSLVK